MIPKDFVNKYWADAVESEKITKVPAIFTLAQCAIESGWGEHAPQNNFFGIKDPNNADGKGQLLTTIEYSSKSTLSFPSIISKVLDPIKKLYKYVVKDYFETYETPEKAFEEHAKFFLVNARYHNSFEYIQSPEQFAEMVAKDGYATDPDYAAKLKKLIRLIDQLLVEAGHK